MMLLDIGDVVSDNDLDYYLIVEDLDNEEYPVCLLDVDSHTIKHYKSLDEISKHFDLVCEGWKCTFVRR